jgi:hypothetical protein
MFSTIKNALKKLFSHKSVPEDRLCTILTFVRDGRNLCKMYTPDGEYIGCFDTDTEMSAISYWCSRYDQSSWVGRNTPLKRKFYYNA